MATRGGGDHQRTVWTPETDRYFIDLLLDQMKGGNKFDDHLFSKRAWKQMTELFNAKFKFQYDKDVLKNRHKTLRNLYRAVRRLLDCDGFSWDDSRLMVTADNSIWEQQLKTHPESRSLRIKSIPYYSDLRLIYGGAELDAEENETAAASEESAAADGNTAAESGGGGEEIPIVLVAAAAVGNRVRTYWQPPMDRYFIDLMMEQVQKGNQIDGAFRKQSWAEMIADFNSKFGFGYDVDVLKNRYKTMKRQYNAIKSLLELNGFTWDDHRQMITADDSVWQDYIKVTHIHTLRIFNFAFESHLLNWICIQSLETHTDARQYMTRPVPYYKDICTICRGDEYNHEEPATSAETKDFGGASNAMVSEIGNKRRLEGQEEVRYPKKHTPAAVAATVSSSQQPISIERVVEAIQALPEMEEDLILDACDLLEDDFKAKTFIALDVKLRKKWLLRKLRP